jgi:mono/diheme cytochrome c family protein
VTAGGGGMPSFRDQLEDGEISAVAKYVSSVAGK